MTELAARHELPREPGFHEIPDEACDQLSFGLLRLEPGQSWTEQLEDREAVLVALESKGAVVSVDGRAFEVPARSSVFDSQPSAVYAPADTTVEASGPLLAGVFLAGAPASPALEPYAVLPDDVSTVERGSGNFKRQVRGIITKERPAQRLLAGETISPAGNWSSSPPHKHDRNAPPEEAKLEEIYLYRVDPAQGFGLQLSYSTEPARERALVVHDLDTVAIPSGYHPVVAGPGYRLYYLWGMAGEGRELNWYVDPAHSWVDAS